MLKDHSDSIYCLLYDSSKNHLFSGSNDNSIKKWDLQNYSLLNTFIGHIGGINCL